MDTKFSGKDFFLQIGTIAALYAGTVALLNLLFTVINTAFPQVAQYGYYSSSSLSLPVATLIVVFPLFLVLANILQKSYAIDPSRKEFVVRKWLIYITLFIAGGVLAGDLITLIYYFLDGQELTTSFLLKVLAVLVVVGAIFGYFTDDLKGRLTGQRRMFWRIAATMLVVGAIIAGFSVLGSPQTQREIRYDNQRASDLQGIQWQIMNHYQQKGAVPASLGELVDEFSGYNVPVDPQSDTSYEYTKTGNLSFELCATFSKPTPKPNANYGGSVTRPMHEGDYYGKGINDNWQHEAGRQCFERTIDPLLYPVRPR